MTDDRHFDRLLSEALAEAGPVRAPERIVESALAASTHVRRRRTMPIPGFDRQAWPTATRRTGLADWPASVRWAFLVAALIVSLAVAAIAGSRLLQPPAPLPISHRFQSTAPMATVRVDAAAATLADGRVLVVGGWNEVFTGLRDGEVDNAAPALATAEIFDPATGRFTTVGPMTTTRQAATATLLDDGRVLVTGGYSTAATADGNGDIDAALVSAEVFDPRSGRFSAVGDMADSRAHHAAVRLDDGSVLVLGGIGWEGGRRGQFAGTSPLSTAEIFDPRTDQFRTVAGTLTAGRWNPTAVKLADGRVLVPGADGVAPEVEVFDPVSETFSGIDADGDPGLLAAAAARLDDGRVLLVGEIVDRQGLRDLEPAWRLFDPRGNAFGPVVGGIAWTDQSVTLDDGRVLLLGSAPAGTGLPVDPRALVFEPRTGSMSAAGPTAVVRERGQVAVRTGTGQVLIAGGLLGTSYDIGSGPTTDYRFEAYDSAELYTP